MSRTRNELNSIALPYHRIVVNFGISLLIGGSDCLVSQPEMIGVNTERLVAGTSSGPGIEEIRFGCSTTNYSYKDISTIKGANSPETDSLLSFNYDPEVLTQNYPALSEREEPSEHRQTLPLQR